MSDYDLVILGGGAAGLAAARAGRWEGASVALISDAPLGGDCTFTGCVPSKSLIEASRQGTDFAEALVHVKSVVDRIASSENAEVMRGEGVDVIEARGRFVGPKTLLVDDRRITGSRVIIATGSTPSAPPITGLADVPYRTNETFFDVRPMPQSLIVIGGGAIGCELGEAMARFGCKVTIVEYAPRILLPFEPDAAALVEASLRSFGIDLRTNAGAESVEFEGSQFRVVAGAEVFESDELLVATGRTPTTADLGLEAAGVETDRHGYIATDKWLRTSAKGVFAAGDVNGKQLLSHAADEMGRVATWTALRTARRYRYDPLRIPRVVFTTPEVASIGVLEADAPDGALVAEAPMSANDRALAAGEPEGFVRLISKPGLLTRHLAGGKLIGATIVGGRAGELINEAALVMRIGAYAGRLAQTVRAYPSWSSIVQKAAAQWFYEYEGTSARPPRR